MSSGRTITILANPVSGRGRALKIAARVASLARARGADVVIHETSAHQDAEAFTREQARGNARPDVFVACGGDGTIQEVVNALAERHSDRPDQCPVLGIAPAGRCNDFSRALGLSGDPRDIVDVLLTGTAQPVDLGRINGRCFCTVVTVGIDADISSYVDGMNLPIRGTLAYIFGALNVLRRYRGRMLTITGDFGTCRQRVFVASAANTSSYGGAINIAPSATPFDAALDFCLIESMSRVRSVAMLVRVLRGTHVGRPEVRFVKTKRVRIESEEPVDLWADGERIGTTPADIEVLAGAVRILLPEQRG